MCGINTTKYGTTPVSVMWNVVRGDTASLKVEFLDSDEATVWDTTDWKYCATAYDKYGDVLDELIVEDNGDHIIVTAPASVTQNWGSRYNAVVANVIFDIQVTIPQTGEDFIWTPIVGNITVLGDVTPGGSL